MKKGRVIAILMAVVLIGSAMAAGCAAPEPSPSPAPSPSPSPAPSPSPSPTPAQPAETIKWISQSALPAGMPVTTGLERLANRIEEASQGRMVWQVNPAGAVCPATEEWKAVHTGVLDVGAGGGAYMTAEIHFGTMMAQRVGGIPPLPHQIWLDTEGDAIANKWFEDLGYDMMNVEGAGFPGPPEIFIHLDRKSVV